MPFNARMLWSPCKLSGGRMIGVLTHHWAKVDKIDEARKLLDRNGDAQSKPSNPHRTRGPCENHNPGRMDDQRHLRSLEGQPATNDGDERGRPALGQASGVRALPAGRLSIARWRATSAMSRIPDAVRTASQVAMGHARTTAGTRSRRVTALF